MEAWEIAHRVLIVALLLLALPFPILLLAGAVAWVVAEVAALTSPASPAGDADSEQ